MENLVGCYYKKLVGFVESWVQSGLILRKCLGCPNKNYVVKRWFIGKEKLFLVFCKVCLQREYVVL